MVQALDLIEIKTENNLHKIIFKKKLDIFLRNIQPIISEENDELLELLNE